MVDMEAQFTAHNVRLDSGAFTKPEMATCLESHLSFVSARRVLETVFPGDKRGVRLVDLGCLEGGYAVEFARLGFQVLGLEVREANFAACRYVKENTSLPNLEFVKDDAWNVARHGTFDAVFCSGLLYHIDQPKRFLELLSQVTRKLLIVQTQFSTERPSASFPLSEIDENEGMLGRWYPEFEGDEAFRNREKSRWASWDNLRSFWPKREFLIQAIQDVGFDLVMEQFDGLGPDIQGSMTSGYYHTDERGSFIGIKTRR